MDFFMQSLYLFQKGGPVMYALALCSLLVVAVTVERFQYYRMMHTDNKAFLATLLPLLEQQKLSEAQHACQDMPAAVAQMAVQGLAAYQDRGDVSDALESSAMLLAAKMRAHLNYLSSVVTLAPLLGLLGTVIGMIQSFSVLNLQTGQPMAITGGVGEALVATAAGLSVAVLAFVAHIILSHRLDGLITDMEEVGAVVRLQLRKWMARRTANEIA